VRRDVIQRVEEKDHGVIPHSLELMYDRPNKYIHMEYHSTSEIP
jgi:hypothetical protein